ncbi:MAG: hypothetical protein IPL53_11315 [Ignavibacteria bacterium]|nr:hypothetical protein [Ignavibacteria bacterium]
MIIAFCEVSFLLAAFLFVITSESFSFSEKTRLSNRVFSLKSDTLKLNDGSDPSQPVSRIDLQNNFYWDWFELKDDRFYNSAQLNGGKAFYDGQLYLYLRIPLITTNLTFEHQTGLGDIFFDIQYSTGNKNKLNFITGSEFIFPTGSSFETGLGKFIAGPYAGIINYFRSGYYGLIITDYFSFAGQSNRDDVSELSISPLFKINLGENWYTLVTPDIIYTFKTGKFFVPYTQEFGKMLSRNITASVKAGVHLKNDNKYDILAEMKFSFLL